MSNVINIEEHICAATCPDFLNLASAIEKMLNIRPDLKRVHVSSRVYDRIVHQLRWSGFNQKNLKFRNVRLVRHQEVQP